MVLLPSIIETESYMNSQYAFDVVVYVDIRADISMNGQKLEEVTSFKYL